MGRDRQRGGSGSGSGQREEIGSGSGAAAVSGGRSAAAAGAGAGRQRGGEIGSGSGGEIGSAKCSLVRPDLGNKKKKKLQRNRGEGRKKKRTDSYMGDALFGAGQEASTPARIFELQHPRGSSSFKVTLQIWFGISSNLENIGISFGNLVWCSSDLGFMLLFFFFKSNLRFFFL